MDHDGSGACDRIAARREVDATRAELLRASFESVVPMASILAVLFAGFLAWNLARLGPAMTPALTAHHAAVIAWFAAVAIAAQRRPDLERVAHAFAAALAWPTVALCLHLELVTGEVLYVAFVGVAVLAINALTMSTAWAVGTAAVAVAAALAASAQAAVAIDAACVLTAACAVGAAIHIARRRCRVRIAGLQVAERRAASARLDATARLASGLAHDFNNLLCVISMNAELLADPRLTDAERAQLCDEVCDASDRGTAIARQLVAFGRQQAMTRSELAVGPEVERLARMLGRAVGPTIDLRVAARTAATVGFDAAQLGQVLLNLAVNARDAMPAGGRLDISVDEVVLDDDVGARHPTASAGPHVAIAVRDTGTGMDEATRARVFDPYFTTKPAGRGSGLGLSMVHGIIHQHGGFIELRSAPGAGTCVTLYLPVLSAGPTARSHDRSDAVLPLLAPSRLALAR